MGMVSTFRPFPQARGTYVDKSFAFQQGLYRNAGRTRHHSGDVIRRDAVRSRACSSDLRHPALSGFSSFWRLVKFDLHRHDGTIKLLESIGL
jgi:hypothetical protein